MPRREPDVEEIAEKGTHKILRNLVRPFPVSHARAHYRLASSANRRFAWAASSAAGGAGSAARSPEVAPRLALRPGALAAGGGRTRATLLFLPLTRRDALADTPVDRPAPAARANGFSTASGTSR